eukprot:3988506-Karenia_brevis.AAC.1
MQDGEWRGCNLVSHNIMTARKLGRLEHIAHEYRNCATVALQGTRLPQSDLAIQEAHIGNFIFYHGLYSSKCSAHAGVALGFNK